jgi:arylsulfatase A-like enzyme
MSTRGFRNAPADPKGRVLSRRWPYVVAALVVISLFLATLFRRDLDPRPTGGIQELQALSSRNDVNVLFILVDTLRAERLGCYGYPRDTSPLLDRLAASGVRFDRHLAQSSWTKASMASLWTSLHPPRSGVTRFDQKLSDQAVLPAEVLREAGFRTAGLWRNGWVSGYFGFDQGFEAYERPRGRPPPASVRRENPTLKNVGTDMDAVDAAAAFLRIYGEERWLLYLHLMDVHEYLYDEDSALFGTSYSDVYDNSIRRTNLVLEQLFLHLASNHLLERTLVVVASDHGEAFGERGFEGHARAVYRETTEVPLILSLPFKLEPGLVVRSRTQNVDIWPTLFELLGLPSREGVDGRSRVPEILAAARGEALAEDGVPAIAHLDQTWGRRDADPSPTVAVTRGSLRYVRTESPGREPLEALFDAGRDPSERDDLLGELPEAAGALRERALAFLEEEPPWGTGEPTLEIDEMQLDQLRALGYKVP